jgi:hypothetical protein
MDKNIVEKDNYIADLFKIVLCIIQMECFS